MDRKAIAVIGTSVVFILLWVFVIVPKYLTPKPQPPTTNAVATATAGGTNTATSPAPVVTSLSASTNAVLPPIATNSPEVTLAFTNNEARYTFTSHGGGLKEIELVRYPAARAFGTKPDTNRFSTLNEKAPLPVMTLTGDASLQGDNVYALTRTTTGVRAEKALGNGLVVVKEFQPTSNYLFEVTVRVENRTGNAVAVGAHELIAGTATPMNATDRGDAVGAMVYDTSGAKEINKMWFDNKFMGCFPGTPRADFRSPSNSVVAWVTTHNQFFLLAAILPTNAAPEYGVVAKPLELPRPPASEFPGGTPSPLPPHGVQVALTHPGFVIQPGAAVTRSVLFYGGPKEYQRILAIGQEHQNNLVKAVGLDSVFPFYSFSGFFAKLLLIGMNTLHGLLNLGYGYVVVLITILIKLLFWPLTAASTRSMKRMAALQPQMKAMEEKYKSDPVKLNEKRMAFWKEHKVNPVGGCLPMLLQMPVFFGFFTMIRSAVELHGAQFLWCHDLSTTDTIYLIGGFPVNPLPLLMGATMLWQARLTPPSPGMDPVQQKIMKYMPLMFIVFLYNYSAALTLYWMTNNLMSILQTKLTKTKDAAAPAAPAAPATPTGLLKRKQK